MVSSIPVATLTDPVSWRGDSATDHQAETCSQDKSETKFTSNSLRNNFSGRQYRPSPQKLDRYTVCKYLDSDILPWHSRGLSYRNSRNGLAGP